MASKEIERSLLNAVYDTRSNLNWLVSEVPDFLVEVNSFKLGVEITEVFADDSLARIRNLPNYLGEILDSGKYRHKNDIGKLRAENLKLYGKDGEFKSEFRAIISEHPGFHQYVGILMTAIKSKNAKVNAYRQNCDKVTLIVHDTERCFLNLSLDDINRTIFVPDTRDMLLKTGFDEIFILSKFKRDEQEISGHISVKLTILFEEIMLVNRVVGRYYPDDSDLQVQAVKVHLETLGFDLRVGIDSEGRVVFSIPSGSVRFSESECAVMVNNFLIDDEIEEWSDVLPFELSAAFLDEVRSFRLQNAFSGTIIGENYAKTYAE